MRIAIDCRLIGQSGIGTFIENNLIHFVKHTEHQFLLIGSKQALAPYYQQSNCHFVECNYRSFTWQELLCFPTDEVNQCDAFYTPNFNIPMGIRIPIYATIHDIVFFETEHFAGSIHTMALRWYIKRALKISKGLFTVSDFTRQRIQDYFHTSRKLKVVYNGLSKDILDYIATHPTPQKRSGFVYVGNIKKYKGLHVLWKAYQRLQQASKDVPPLTIIGRFDFRTKDAEMLQILEENKDKIRLVTDADNQQLYELLSKAQCLVSPSLYEGFGIPPLEAMSLGTPVILSDIPVYQEIYGQFPVTFFKAGDSDDLFEKLKTVATEKIDVKELIASNYTYKKTAADIIQHITDDIDRCNC